MKKLYTLIVSLIVFTGVYAQIPNPSFETWTPYASGEYPTSWHTTDSAYQLAGGGHSAVREITDVCNLSNAVKLISVTTLLGVGPGVASNGILGLNTVSGGTPFTARPLQFTGCYKYIPAASDSGRIFALLTKWNGTARDTIALAASFPHLQNTMTNFSIPFVYWTTVTIPDTILIVLSSGQGVNQTTAGSVLTVDNLGTAGALGISENQMNKNLNIFPQPAQNELHFNIPSDLNVSLNYEMIDLNGKLVLSGKINSSDSKVDISKLSGGNYFISLKNSEGVLIYSSKFNVAK